MNSEHNITKSCPSIMQDCTKLGTFKETVMSVILSILAKPKKLLHIYGSWR